MLDVRRCKLGGDTTTLVLLLRAAHLADCEALLAWHRRDMSPRLSSHPSKIWQATFIVAGTLAVGRLLAITSGPVAIDKWLWRPLDFLSVPPAAWRLVSGLGSVHVALFVAILVGGAIAGTWLTHGWRVSLLAGLGVPIGLLGLGSALEFIMKPLVGRMWGSVPAYPSGHAGGTAVLVGLVWVLARPGKVRSRLTSWLSVWSAAVGIAMVAKHSHYPTDVLGGWAVGLASGYLLGHVWIRLLVTPRGGSLVAEPPKMLARAVR